MKHPGVALTEGRVGDFSAVQLVGAIRAVVPAITHGLQHPALTVSTGELCRAAGLCKMRGQRGKAWARAWAQAGSRLAVARVMPMVAGLPAGSQPVPMLTTPVLALLGHWPKDIQVSGCRALLYAWQLYAWQPWLIGDHCWPWIFLRGSPLVMDHACVQVSPSRPHPHG